MANASDSDKNKPNVQHTHLTSFPVETKTAPLSSHNKRKMHLTKMNKTSISMMKLKKSKMNVKEWMKKNYQKVARL